jgi:hypothetical protein
MQKLKLYLLGGLFCALLILAFHYAFSSLEDYGNIVDILSILLASVAATITCREYLACRKKKVSEAPIFLYLAIALALWAVAEGLWAYYEILLQDVAPQPSLADALWLIGYLPYTYSLYLAYEFIRFHLRAALMALLSYLLIGSTVLFLLKDVMVSSEASFELNLINIGYVVGDSLLLSLSMPLIAAFFLRQTSRTWVILGIAISIMAIADIWYFQLAALDEYAPSHIVNMLYLISNILICVGILSHSDSAG